jgi:hypothetical protein
VRQAYTVVVFDHFNTYPSNNFLILISTNEIFLNIHYLSFTIFFDLEEIIFENFNISENNIISVELAKALGYLVLRPM